MKVRASCRQERMAVFHGDFFQGFEAIGHEARAEHVHTSDALACKLLQRGSSCGLQPFGAAKSRLECNPVLLCRYS